MNSASPLRRHLFRISLEAARLLLAASFLFSGGVKAIDPMGGAIKIEEYLRAFGMEQFEFLATLGAFNLCAMEFALGACLLVGAFRGFTTLIMLLFMAAMTALTLYLALFDPVSDCGCFGDALRLSNWETFGKNVLLLSAALFTFCHWRKLARLLPMKVLWLASFLPYTLCIGFAWWNYNHLPLVDFRPFKVGANIPELMSIPEGAAEDEYRHTLVYEKAGQRQHFPLDSIPAEGSGWTFVEAQSELLKQGYRPLVESFQLFDAKGEEVSDFILSQEKPVYLLIMPDAATANEENTDIISDIYDRTVEEGSLFYAVVGSSDASFQEWTDYTGAEYPHLKADATLLKTIVRSNPGLVLLHKGTIIQKLHYNDLANDEQRTLPN